MNTLHLTTGEVALYQKLPASLREGWTVQEEKLTFTDTIERMHMRADFAKIHDETTKDLVKKIAGAKSADDAAVILQSMDKKTIDTVDLLEFAFVIGPDGLSTLLRVKLESASTDDDLLDAAGLSELRHELLESLQNFA